jgi:hypothetical protein
LVSLSTRLVFSFGKPTCLGAGFSFYNFVCIVLSTEQSSLPTDGLEE